VHTHTDRQTDTQKSEKNTKFQLGARSTSYGWNDGLAFVVSYVLFVVVSTTLVLLVVALVLLVVVLVVPSLY